MNAICGQCGGEIVAGDAFCTSCGAPYQPLVPEANAMPAQPTVDSLVGSPVETGSGAAQPAPIGRRAMSWAIDVAIIVVAFVATSAIHELLGVVVLVGGTSAYYVLMIGGQWHGTVGHRIVGLSVVDAESRETIGPRTAGLRLAINAVLALPFGLGLFLNIPMVDRSVGRTVHDVGSGTIVVATR
jgi:uncharacterized RDD family membrane protein YckC